MKRANEELKAQRVKLESIIQNNSGVNLLLDTVKIQINDNETHEIKLRNNSGAFAVDVKIKFMFLKKTAAADLYSVTYAFD